MNIWKVIMVMTLAGVSQVGIEMAYGNPDTGPGCGLGKPSALIKALDEAMAGHPVLAKVEAAH